MVHTSPRRAAVGLLVVGTLAISACSATKDDGGSESEREREAAAAAGLKAMPHNALEKYMMIAGTDPGEAARESREAATLGEQYAEARTAPGVVDSGAYTAAYGKIQVSAKNEK